MNNQLVLTIIGAVSTLIGAISHFINPEVSPPLPALAVVGLLAAAALYTSKIAK